MASFIQSIEDAIKLGPKLASQADALKTFSSKSISKGAKDSTFQFPCLMSDTVPVDMANTTARMLDKVYAAFSQTWLSMNSMFDITIDPTPLSYLKRLHQNLAIESVTISDKEDIDRYNERIYDGSYRLYMTESKDFGILFNMTNKDVAGLVKSNKEFLESYMSEFDLTPLENIPVTEAINDETSKADLMNAYVDTAINNHMYARNKDLATLTGKSSRAPKLTDRDIKRSNDVIPYGIEIRLLAVNDKKEFVQYVDFIVGIKTVLHSVKSDDMVDNLVRALQNKDLAFKLLRWSTGEISLVKDILLNIDDLKFDATANNARSPFFNYLKRLKTRKFGLRNLTVPHKLIPNTTVVVTTYEIDYIRNHYAIDLMDAKNGLKLLDALFLMGFIILDEGTNTMFALWDGDHSYQTFSLESLERENIINQNRLGKEIGRMVTNQR